MRHYKITAKGRVQGVGYRKFTKYLADERGCVGTVRNVENGDVEIFISLNDLGEFLGELYKGNGKSKTSSFEIEILQNLDFKTFEVLQ